MLVCNVLTIFLVLVVANSVLSWFPSNGGVLDQIREMVDRATRWALDPLRRVLPPVRMGSGALDLSPLVVILGIWVLQGIIC